MLLLKVVSLLASFTPVPGCCTAPLLGSTTMCFFVHHTTSPRMTASYSITVSADSVWLHAASTKALHWHNASMLVYNVRSQLIAFVTKLRIAFVSLHTGSSGSSAPCHTASLQTRFLATDLMVHYVDSDCVALDEYIVKVSIVLNATPQHIGARYIRDGYAGHYISRVGPLRLCQY